MLRLWHLRTTCILNNYNVEPKPQYNLKELVGMMCALRNALPE